jgi:hypothetical protein
MSSGRDVRPAEGWAMLKDIGDSTTTVDALLARKSDVGAMQEAKPSS